MLDNFLVKEHWVLFVQLLKALSLVLALEDFLELEIFHDFHGICGHSFVDRAWLVNFPGLGAQGILAFKQAILGGQIDV